MRILLVDDHPDTLALHNLAVTEMGHTVITASSAAEAMVACEQDRFDLLICDVVLPDGDGWTLMRCLAERWGICGIALTARAYPDDIRKSEEAGFIAHLSKPVDFDALARAIDDAVSRCEPSTPASTNA